MKKMNRILNKSLLLPMIIIVFYVMVCTANWDHIGLVLIKINNVMQLFQLQNKCECEIMIINIIIILALIHNIIVNNMSEFLINSKNSSKWDCDSSDSKYNSIFSMMYCQLHWQSSLFNMILNYGLRMFFIWLLNQIASDKTIIHTHGTHAHTNKINLDCCNISKSFIISNCNNNSNNGSFSCSNNATCNENNNNNSEAIHFQNYVQCIWNHINMIMA